MAETQIPHENNRHNEASGQQWVKLKQERDEYFEKLKKWIDDARLAHYKAISGMFNNVNTPGNTNTNASNVHIGGISKTAGTSSVAGTSSTAGTSSIAGTSSTAGSANIAGTASNGSISNVGDTGDTVVGTASTAGTSSTVGTANSANTTGVSNIASTSNVTSIGNPTVAPNFEQLQYQINNLNAVLAQANLWNQNLQNVLRHRIPSNSTPSENAVNRLYATTATFQTNQRPSVYEFIIPPLWKRVVAELMDFLILFLVKMALTFVLLESFDIIDLKFYGFETFQKNLENPEIVMPMAIEWLTLEFLHRFIVCAYETYFLKGKFFATPGKRYMGLMVITVEHITSVPGRTSETISATGAAPLNWQKSLTRAAMKNLFVGLLLPLCVAFYIFPYNRTSYDMMSNSIVVEYQQEFMVYHSTV
ncbi:hypothetical protein NQ315_013259 [Exocentrus adspersus]|uniref:RDD domain-containing protein n=1 Tax=Exocentrus adspersus TaxID=1586481 RepID=A0AAV8VLT9_9CUCU|nr:hypothetical protein NQ315_013259 [Exocentrus adspersus]